MACGCVDHKVFDLTGTWSGAGSNDRFASVVLTVRQDDGNVSGVVCRVSSGHRVFRDVTVSGTYPSFTFQYFGDTVTGWAAAEDLIVAHRTGAVAEELRFTRTSSAAYESCRNMPE